MMKQDRLDLIRQHGLKYVRTDGLHLTGIPSRNLTPEECGQLSVWALEDCLGSGLYEIALPEKSAKEQVK